jgi:hypothetical protein
MTYSHRNGETEPPTEDGYYWLRSVPGDLRRAIGITEILEGEPPEGLLTFEELAGVRWWGPVTPPWDEDNG